MLSVGSLAFLNPWLLAGLLALPILWWLLRAIPPAPKRQAFAAVRLLLGLQDEERQADKTPWWLLLLRAAAIAAALIGLAQPVLNPTERLAGTGDGPLLLLMDQGWASAPDWTARQALAVAALDEAGQSGRQVVFWPIADGNPSPVADADALRPVVEGTRPAPLEPDPAQVLAALDSGALARPGQTIWLHDGLARGDATEALAARLAELAPLRLVGPSETAAALTPPRLEDGGLVADILRAGGPAATLSAIAMARADQDGPERRIAVGSVTFTEGQTQASVRFDLPPELTREVSRLMLADRASAGGAALAGGSIRRVSVGIVDPAAESTPISLTSASHYLRKAIAPHADLREGTLAEMLEHDPAAMVLADYGAFAEADRVALTEWVEAGGLLIRFAGPRLAAALDEQVNGAGDALLPVRLRRGGRVLGGALAWGKPRSFGPFPEDGLFRRLEIPDEVDVRTQVLAEPAPDLSDRVWASLDDGTPLVTGTPLANGHVVLFHVTADAEWSSLPLSGLFVEMLGRLLVLAPGQQPEAPSVEDLAGTLWRADLLMGTDGVPVPAPSTVETVAGERLAEMRAGSGLPPGLYARADGSGRRAGEASEVVVNLFREGDSLAPFPPAPSSAIVETLGGAQPQRFGQWLLAIAIALALVDVFAALWLSGRLSGPLSRAARPAATGLLVLGVLVAAAPGAQAQQTGMTAAIEATAETTLGYVLTGQQRVDRLSARGMEGLGFALTQRTAVEPGPPVGLDPAVDELALYPVIYWPLLADAVPGDDALARLAAYLAGGGMLVIDTQNGTSGFGGASATQMRRIARALNLPPLEPVDETHVLTRAFYLLDRFPGRWRGGQVWAEARPTGADGRARDPELAQFDRVDDEVSPVLVGSADWALAWAIDERGAPLVPIGRAGDRQRELAIRFGVNAVLYALTGNYKSDQVHAPEVLRRLGQ